MTPDSGSFPHLAICFINKPCIIDILAFFYQKSILTEYLFHNSN